MNIFKIYVNLFHLYPNLALSNYFYHVSEVQRPHQIHIRGITNMYELFLNLNKPSSLAFELRQLQITFIGTQRLGIMRRSHNSGNTTRQFV